MDEAPSLIEFELAQRRRKIVGRTILGAVVVTLLLGAGMCVKRVFFPPQPPPAPLGESERRVIGRMLNEVRAAQQRAGLARAERLVLTAAVRSDLLRLSPRPDLGDCPTRLPLRRRTKEGYAPPTFVLHRLSKAEVETALVAEDAPASDEPYEVFFVAEQSLPPLVGPGSTFRPGRVSGRAFLWDHAFGRILCVADVQATNSAEVKTTEVKVRGSAVRDPARAVGYLQQDLDVELERAIAKQLRSRGGPARVVETEE